MEILLPENKEDGQVKTLKEAKLVKGTYRLSSVQKGPS